MKAGFKKTADMVATLLILAAGCWIIYGSMLNQTMWEKVLEAFVKAPLFGAAFGGVLILAVLLRIVSAGQTRDKTHFLTFDSEDGSVGISSKAVRDFIERVGGEFAGIKSMESTLIMDKGALDIELHVKVLVGNKIPELSHVLQARVRESVRDALGLEEIRNIKIKVQEIVGEPVKPAETAAAE